jgi:hypothetical protein
VRGRVLLVVLTAALTIGCALSDLPRHVPAVQMETFVRNERMVELTKRAVTSAETLAAVLGIVLGFVCWYQATEGASWGRLARTYVVGMAGCAFVLGSWNVGVGVPATVRWLGLWAERAVFETNWQGDTPGPWAGYFRLGGKVSSLALRLFAVQGGALGDQGTGDPNSAEVSYPAAVAHWLDSGFGAVFLQINSVFAFVLGILVRDVQAWLVGFYTLVGPFCALALVLPASRAVFWGWLRAYGSVCLWSLLLRANEAFAMVWVDVFRGSVPAFADNASPGGALAVAVAIESGAMGLLVLNLLISLGYLTVPVAAHLLVNAAGRPFRGAV